MRKLEAQISLATYSLSVCCADRKNNDLTGGGTRGNPSIFWFCHVTAQIMAINTTVFLTRIHESAAVREFTRLLPL